MRRLPPKLIAVIVVLAVLLGVHDARAQAAPASASAPDAGACQPLEHELLACRDASEAARNEATAAEKRAATCAADLSNASTKVRECSENAARTEESRAHLCSATSAFADEIARGHATGASETGCVSPEQQKRIDAFVGGWSGTTTTLSQLAAYESGETDTVPRPRSGATPLERALSRVLRDGGGRMLHRRLLVEALELIAPHAWARLKAGGASAIDAWFADRGPLDPDLVEEAQHADAAAPGPGGPPLTAALHLVRAFRLAARCNVVTDAQGECTRARQLEQLLETSGSLVVRRRIQEIWATECSTMGPDVVGRWIEDFPTANRADLDPWHDIVESAYTKLFACYLDDSTVHSAFGAWLKERLPPATAVSSTRLARVDAIRSLWSEPSADAACASAVRAMQTMAPPARCAVPMGGFRRALGAWAASPIKLEAATPPVAMCSEFAQLLWEGKAASIDGAFSRPPSVDEMVVAKPMPPTPMWRLRAHCEERRGDVDHFAADVVELSTLARRFGEAPDAPPYRVDPKAAAPVELVRYRDAGGAGPWLSHVARGVRACSVVGLSDERCKVCSGTAGTGAYDCALVARLEASWTERTRDVVASLAVFFVVLAASLWARRLRRGLRSYARWAAETTAFFEGIGLACRRDRLRLLLPSRLDTILVTLPSDPSWERWGTTAAIVRAPEGRHVVERDVNHAAFVARREGAAVVLLEHDDDATLDLSAVRAMLEWAAKGGARAVQILPIGVSRARWSKSTQDVLDLVEESSLRGNPFELRGRVATSNQFFNRERLVSGLLAAAQAGHWVVVTGLRRFGKSSLVLEVARRLPGPSAYVDVAGFDHEIANGTDAGAEAASILRFVCIRLAESARSRWPRAELPDAPSPGAAMDATELTRWLRALSRSCQQAAGRSTPVLVVLDELEQALATGPERLAHAIDVLAIVIGRLKSAVGDAAMPDGGSSIGVFLTSALHPVLWAPLRTLAQQSIMGSFQRVCVPCLDVDAATTMMRSLGGRQGIRFREEALARIVDESNGIPLLLRRLGASILELYDADRAREGSLGAVEIGTEGTNEAVEREAREGSPLRVWIETEIAARASVPGALLRRLARTESVEVAELHEIAQRRIAAEFARSGMARALSPDELARRTEEAAHVIVQLLEESGLLVPHGDLTKPHAYSLPDGALRRVLAAQESLAMIEARPPA